MPLRNLQQTFALLYIVQLICKIVNENVIGHFHTCE